MDQLPAGRATVTSRRELFDAVCAANSTHRQRLQGLQGNHIAAEQEAAGVVLAELPSPHAAK